MFREDCPQISNVSGRIGLAPIRGLLWGPVDSPPEKDRGTGLPYRARCASRKVLLARRPYANDEVLHGGNSH